MSASQIAAPSRVPTTRISPDEGRPRVQPRVSIPAQNVYKPPPPRVDETPTPRVHAATASRVHAAPASRVRGTSKTKQSQQKKRL